jgi:hypothetical protein
MRRPIRLALLSGATFLILANAALPARQSSGTLANEPASTDPQVTLSPEKKAQFQSLMSRWLVQQQTAGQTQVRHAHSLLDQALTGDPLPPEVKSSFADMFTPSHKDLHRFLDEQYLVFQNQFKKSGQPDVPRSGMEQSIATVESQNHRAGTARLHPVSRRGHAEGHSVGNGLLQVTQAESSGNTTTTESDGVTEVETSGQMENGTHVTVKGENWHDTDNWIADGGGLGMEFGGERKGMAGTIDISAMDGAKVKRCPSATGVVPGKGRRRGGFILTATDAKGTTYQVGSTGFTQMTADGQVGDDAILKQVKATVTTTLTGRWNGDVYVVRVDGTATFDPHSSEEPAVQRTGCSSNAGTPPIGDCDLVTKSINLSGLKRAYVKAEKKWNFEQRDEGGSSLGTPSACVMVKFTPKTKTVRGRPKQSVAVKAEIVTIHGEQPTWGHFDELDLWDSPGGTIQENGTATAPDAPAQLTYTAPPQPWPPNKAPGFYVRKMTSRAGAFKWGVYVAGLDPDSFVWQLKPGLKLSIHHKWEVNGPGGHLLSEITFPIDLSMNERGDLFGQTALQRTYDTVGGAGGVACIDKGQWPERWQAYGIFDEKGENLTLKLRFDAGLKQAVGVCRTPAGPITRQHTVPGFSSDGVRTPLDQFRLPAQDGAKQQFVFDFGGFAKNVVDVKLEDIAEEKK